MPREISYTQLPSIIAANSKAVKFAAANTLNDIAFDGVRAIPQKATLNFRRNARRALGFQVKKARARRNANASDIEAQVFTERGWVAFHVEEGRRRATEGWRFNGVSFIMVPNAATKATFFTLRGRLRAKFRRSLFVVPNRRGGTVLHRDRRTRRVQVVAFLRRDVSFHEDLNYEETMDKLFTRNVTNIFRTNMRKELRRQLTR